MKKEIEILARAIIQTEGKILVCKRIGKEYYFFPGGHVEFRESAKEALVREIKEELGLTVKKCSFIGSSEHIFIQESEECHEINLAFEVKVNKLKIRSRENHIEFFLKSTKELAREEVLPIALTKAVLKWLKDKKPFWTS